jgi:hypothetical protein
MKVCTDCGEEKDESEFHNKGKKKDGTVRKQSICKFCKAKLDREAWIRKKAKIAKEPKPKDDRPWWPEDYLSDNIIKLSRMAWV